MHFIKLLIDGEIVTVPIFTLVGKIRGKKFEVLGYPEQGRIMHDLLKGLGADRSHKTGAGTMIRDIPPKSTGGPDEKSVPKRSYAMQKWIHRAGDEKTGTEHHIMHVSSGDKSADPSRASATIFFYREKTGNRDIVVVAAGHHVKGTSDYNIVWGLGQGYRAAYK